MSTTTLTSSRTPTQQAMQRPNPLLSVLTWELRRFRASRLFWIQALGFFGLVLFVIWATATPQQFFSPSSNGSIFTVFVAPTSIWILLLTVNPGLLLLPGLLLPFVNADGVTRDVQRRTHELLMVTALPSWAYVWGRYLTGLLISLGLALLTLAALLVMDLFLHLTVSTDPFPPTGAVLLLWGGMVVPATILLSSVSFALGTLLPRQSTLVKISMLLVWVVGLVILPNWIAPDSTPAWYSAWDPTSAGTALALLRQYPIDFQSQSASATTAAQAQHILLTVENSLPTIGSWLAPHLIEGGASLLLAALAAFAFRRFRNVING
jgi:ABC-type transport system involved in multi-copper enzyme maturation permease subunit